MKHLILDSEAISILSRKQGSAQGRKVVAALVAARNRGADVVVPAAVLAEQYRGGKHDHLVDATLSRYPAIEVADTTRGLARSIGNLLARADRGSADHVDASVVATAARVGGGLILTSDPDDITHLAHGVVGVDVFELR